VSEARSQAFHLPRHARIHTATKALYSAAHRCKNIQENKKTLKRLKTCITNNVSLYTCAWDA